MTNGIPDILNREYKGGILLKDGEQAVVAGMVTESDEKTLSRSALRSPLSLVSACSLHSNPNSKTTMSC